MWLQSRYLRIFDLVFIIFGIILLQTPNASGSNRYVRQVTCDRFSDCVGFRQCIFWRKKFGSIPPNKHLSKLREINCAQFNTRNPMVCCPGDNKSPLISSVRTKPLRPNSVVREPLPTNCGHVTVTDKIIGGTDAGIGDYPWMASIGYGSAARRQFKCGGALISTRFVLTAAHCTTDDKIEIVRLGEQNFKTSPDCIHTRSGKGFCAPKEEDYRVEKVIAHENYDTRGTASDDIALIKLEKTVTFSAYIFPICMPEQNADIEAQVTLKGKTLVAGWGYTKTSFNDPILKKVDLPFVNKNACRERFAKLNYRILDEQICFGGEEGKDSCDVDSGGPLMHPKQGAGPPYDLIGLVSFGIGGGCGREGNPGVYTNVQSYRQWIVNNMIL